VLIIDIATSESAEEHVHDEVLETNCEAPAVESVAVSEQVLEVPAESVYYVDETKEGYVDETEESSADESMIALETTRETHVEQSVAVSEQVASILEHCSA
jgi:hypothetical protein